jgi:hypothetical protein
LGLLFSVDAFARGATFGAGLGAGATVVLGPEDVVVVRQAARALLYHLVQSVVVEVVDVVFLTAPADLPVGVCAPAVLQAALLALPALVQSYCRVVVFVVVAVVVVRAGVAGFAAVLGLVLQAALLALPGFEQS